MTLSIAEGPTPPPPGLPRLPRTRGSSQRLALDLSTIADADLLHLVMGGRGRLLPEAMADQLRRDGWLGLAAWDAVGLQTAFGVSSRSATMVAGVIEVSRRLARSRRGARPLLQTPEQVSALLGNDLALLPHEELWCLPLDPRSRLIGPPRVVSRGDVDGTEAGPRAFLRLALIAGASSAIAVHNHPTGDPAPSAADRAVTLRLVAAGRAIDLPVVDHVVIGDGGRFVSLRRETPELFRGPSSLHQP